MAESIKIRRALISVYDKTGIVDFARALRDEFGIEIISTGGTAKTLTNAGIPVTLVEDITGFPEMMDGRVKTLHPKIHAAILADRDNPEHMRQLKAQGIEPIDMVVVNLYPFEKTIARPDCTFEEAIEMIDIGGVCLLRAAAKNHKHVLVVTQPRGYDSVLRILRGDPTVMSIEDERKHAAFETFSETHWYDATIWQWLGGEQCDGAPTWLAWQFFTQGALRYGENPHQNAKVLTRSDQFFFPDLADAVIAGLGEFQHETAAALSFNNYADANAALELCAELTRAGQHLWDRFETGHPSCGTGLKPVRPTPAQSILPVSREQLTRRHLPHIQRPGATYFVTFRLGSGLLTPQERDIALSACAFWHTKKMTLHAACVMPEHVHMLFTPHEVEPDKWVSLGELLHSIKRFSAREINKLRGVEGSLWLDESFDRVVRDEDEFREKWEYIEANPVTAGLVQDPREYRWFWRSEAGFGEVLVGDEVDRLQTGPTEEKVTDRLQTGPTVQEKASDRLETGPTGSCVCFIKHTNACGAAVGADPTEAYRKAYLGDPNAAMGGILAVNFNVDASFAEAVMKTYRRWGKRAGAGGFFVEVWLAPSFDQDAVEIIRSRTKWGQRVRLLDVGDMSVEPDPSEMDLKRIAGGVLMQDRDLVGLNEKQWKVVTKRQPTDTEMDDLRLAWLICKHTKSNAVTICKDGMLIGNGAGQMSRVMSCRIATWLAKDNGHEERLMGAVAASDAFFPFRDGPDHLIDAGVTALIQPGGSKRDQEVIDACGERGVAMIFTGTRHFKH